MEITQGNLETVFGNLKAMFDEAVQTADRSEIERLMQTTPALVGPTADAITQSVPNLVPAEQLSRTFARIVQIRRNDIADDNIGVYAPGVRQLGRRAALYPLRLAAEVLLSGFSDQWVDGAAIFSASHRWPGGQTWSNRTDLALHAESFQAAVAALERRPAPDGAPLGVTPNLLVCGPACRVPAEEILHIERTLRSEANLLVLASLGTSPAWFVMDTDPLRPLVLKNELSPELTPQDDPTDEDAFYRELHAYRGRRRCGVAVLAPWLIQASAGI